MHCAKRLSNNYIAVVMRNCCSIKTGSGQPNKFTGIKSALFGLNRELRRRRGADGRVYAAAGAGGGARADGFQGAAKYLRRVRAASRNLKHLSAATAVHIA